MAYENGLAVANLVKSQLGAFARTAANDLADGKLSALEAAMLGAQGLAMGANLSSMFMNMNKLDMQELLYVLEHSTFTLSQ
jgi:hypothetical protein